MTTEKTGGGSAGKAAERQARLAKALRDNLKKRKGQARERASAGTDPAPGQPANGKGTGGA